MKTQTRKQIMNCSDFNQLLNAEYGKRGTRSREQFEAEAEAFVLGELVRQERETAGLTRQQLAEQSGCTKTTISRLEQGHSNVSLNSVFHIFAGMGKKVAISLLTTLLLLTLGAGQMWADNLDFSGNSYIFIKNIKPTGWEWTSPFIQGAFSEKDYLYVWGNNDATGYTGNAVLVEGSANTENAVYAVKMPSGNYWGLILARGENINISSPWNKTGDMYFTSRNNYLQSYGNYGQSWSTYVPTSTASLAASSTSITTVQTSTLTPSLSSNSTYNEIKSTSYSVTTNPGSAGSVTSAGVFSATAAGTYKVTATVTYNAKDFSSITKTATATETITVTAAAETTYSVTFNAGANGSISAKGTAISAGNNSVVAIGATARPLTATPSSGYRFTGWEKTGSVTIADASSDNTTVSATGTGTVTATWAAKTPVRLYYSNPNNWATVYAYVYDASNTSDINAEWHGVDITSNTYVYNCNTYYYYEYYKEDHPDWDVIIFNDNDVNQTADLTFSNTTNNGQYTAGTADDWTSSPTVKWALKGSWDDWDDASDLTCASATSGYAELDLDANRDYSFKFVDQFSDTWYGVTSATNITYSNKATAQTMSNTAGGSGNQTITTAGAGTYRFTWDITNKKVTVTYPTSYTVTLDVGTVKGNSRTPAIYVGTVADVNKISSGSYVANGSKVIFWIANSAETAPKAGYEWWGFYDNAAGSDPTKYTNANVSTYTVNSISSNMSVYAVFGEIDYYITPYINGQGTVTPADGQNGHIATPVSFTASAGTGYMFSSWEERGGSALTIESTTSATTDVNASAAGTLQANFVPRWSVLGTPSDPFGGWDAYSTNLFTGYTTVSTKDVGYKSVTLAANTTYEIKVYDRQTSTLYGGSANQDIYYANGGTEYSIATTGVSAKSVFIHSAAAGSYTLDWNLTDKKIAVEYPTSWYITSGQKTTGQEDEDGGSFTAVDGSSNNVKGGKFVANSASVTFTASPNTGYTFGGWYSDASCTTAYTAGTYVAFSGANNSVMTLSSITADKTVYAKFTPKTYTVTLSQTGAASSGTASVTATYNAALPAIGTLPTAANGYAFMGYYSAANGTGTQFTNASGTWVTSVTDTISDSKWVLDAGATLYAYFKKAEITELALAASIVGTAATDSITVTPTISPTPTGTTKVCWEIQYSNGTALPSQPAGRTMSGNAYRFKAPSISATYKIQCKLYTGSECGSGTLLSTLTTTFQVAGTHTVTIRYQDGDGRTIKASTEIEGRPLEWTTAGDITPPTITGYTFARWDAGDGVSIKNGDSDPVTTTTTSSIQIKATYDGTLTAVYTKKRLIFFNNTLGWSGVTVYFYSGAYWDASNGSGSNTGGAYTDICGEMTQIEGTDIWYYDAEAAGVNSSYTYVAFTEEKQNHYGYFSYKSGTTTPNNVIYRGDYKSTTLPMYVPLAGVEGTLMNSNQAKYFNEGYWMNYPENTGYTVHVYSGTTYGTSDQLQEIPFVFSEDNTLPMSINVELNAGRTYGFEIHRADGTVLGDNSYTLQSGASGDAGETTKTLTTSQRSKITTNVAGDYTFTLSYGNSSGYKYLIGVHYPAATGDYRIVYNDRVAWSGATHGAGYWHESRTIQKKDGAEDIVSFFVSKADGASASMKFQYVSAINASTGAVTWADVASGSIDLSSITETGVYDFHLSQAEGAISVSSIEPYTGNYYIRTDCAGSTKWENFRSTDHQMTYSDYAESNSGYSHYFCHWVTNGTNVKFCIANDYSLCISDTLSADYGTAIATIDGSGNLSSASANIRFMWNQSTNKISRAYIGGSGYITDRFLVLEGDSKLFDENGGALTNATSNRDHRVENHGSGDATYYLDQDNQVILNDDENFVYERTIQVKTKAEGKLTAKYNSKVQYFIGGADETVELLGGDESETKYSMRIVYDFKTNRLVKAYIPSGSDITEDLAINADIMLVREHQEAGQQLTFGGGKLTKVKTVYGVMRFNRWTLNNKSTADGHAVLGDPKSNYERGLYWISFPFDVNLSDVFGFGTYGTHWIIMEYDGAERASKGYWQDSQGFWKYVTSRTDKTLEAGKGYVLALDLDLMKDNNTTFWANDIEQVELFFPSASEVANIEATDTEITVPAHECTITPRPGQTDDRTKKDSHWNIIGVPSYANYGTALKDGSDNTVTWKNPETQDLPYLYEWNSVDNSYTAQTGTTYPFKTMHAYMVQYNGKLKWSLASATPASVAARRTDAPKNVEFRLEIQQNDKMIDQTFVRLTNDEAISANFDFNYDLSKQMNSGKANIYTMVEGYIQTAGNILPLSEQTTIVPVGVKVVENADYTFSIPDGTSGVGITLIDRETGTRTNLSALDYTVSLEAGTCDERFVIEISPISQVITDIESTNGEDDGISPNGAHKVLIDGLLYIVRDGKMYDARGARVE
ncbi:MAG: helix-turn-helix domain-containing protein [Paludibacteraceae bacterium]|nr:helix-turn-helix domain-containing protein [Paludibacteraceae bacterium]